MSLSAAIMSRLGLVLTGTNAQLEVIKEPKKEEKPESAKSNQDSEEDEDGGEEEDPDDAGDSNHGEDDPLSQDEEASEDSEEEEDGEDSEEDEGGTSGGKFEDDEEDEDSGGGESDDEEDGDEGEDNSDDERDEPDDEPVSEEPSKDTEGGTSAGGTDHVEETEAIDAEELAQSLLAAMEKGEEAGLKDSTKALEAGIGEEAKEDCEKGEQAWRPYDPSLDEVRFATGGEKAGASAKLMQAKVKPMVSFLKNQMRSKFLQANAEAMTHGVRKGGGLSERRLVNSMVEIRAGKRPTRPDWLRTPKEVCSLACAIVLDESGSMSSLRTLVAQAAIAVAEPLDILGSPCLVVGPRNGQYGYHSYGDLYDPANPTQLQYHRTDGIIIDVFKDWDESMTVALPRFGSVQATGGTPLGDGIQYALQEISNRPERHRVVLVITDGCPDNSQIVARQIRIAREAGIHIIGVGISSGCSMVGDLFKEYLCVEDLPSLPNELLKVLTGIMFPRQGGKKVQFETGKLGQGQKIAHS